MNLHELMTTQEEFDKTHGWETKNLPPEKLLDTLSNDLIALFGEVGEFSNIVKKIKRDLQNQAPIEELINNNRELLSEELIDTFIYLIRIANTLEINFEEEYKKKLKLNKNRFKIYEK